MQIYFLKLLIGKLKSKERQMHLGIIYAAHCKRQELHLDSFISSEISLCSQPLKSPIFHKNEIFSSTLVEISWNWETVHQQDERKLFSLWLK